MPLIQFLQVILRRIHWELCTHVYIFLSVLSLKDVVKSWKFNVEERGKTIMRLLSGSCLCMCPHHVESSTPIPSGGCPHYRWEGNDLWAQQDRSINPYWKLSIVKIWSPINIVQVIIHLSNEKPSRQVGVSLLKSGLPISLVIDAWPPKMRLQVAGKGRRGSPLWILVMCIWLCQLILFLKLNVMCWKILSWWINELKEALIFE